MIKSTPDVERLSKVLEKIGYGIYYYHHGEKFEGKLQVFSAFFISEEGNYNTFKELIIDQASEELANKQEFGENPEIFSYCFAAPDIHGILALRVKFYGGVEVYYAFAPIGFSLERDFTKLSIDAGWETTIHVNGKAYTLNKPEENC